MPRIIVLANGSIICEHNDFTADMHALMEEILYLYPDYVPSTQAACPLNLTIPAEQTTTSISKDNSKTLPRVYGNVLYALDAYEHLVPTVFIMMLILIVVCFTVFFVQYKSVSPISNSVHAMLCTITLFNFLTIAGSFAEHTHLYRSKTDFGMLPFEACKPLYALENISRICRAVSVWLTASMCVQKAVCVYKPFIAARIVSMNATLFLIGISILLGLCPFIVSFFDSIFLPFSVAAANANGALFVTCRRSPAEFIKDWYQYKWISAWLGVLVTRFIPCLIILAMSALIVVTLKRRGDIVLRMNRNTKGGPTSQKGGTSQKTRVTLLVCFVAAIVLSAELTTGTVFVLVLLQVYDHVDFFDSEATQRAAFGIDVVLYLSYAVVLVSYCLTPRTLRRFKERMSEIFLTSHTDSVPVEASDSKRNKP